MRSIPTDVEVRILMRLLEGATYRQVAREFGVCIATVSRIVEDARKKAPDIDELRDLSAKLRKSGLSVFDAERACRLVENLNRCGINQQKLEAYLELTEKYLSDKDLGEDFMTCALELMQLEQEHGQPYKELVRDLRKELQDFAQLRERKKRLEKSTLGIETDLEKAKQDLAAVNSELEKATTVKKGLAEIGLNRLARLVKLIKEFESLGANPGEAQKLALWRRKLRKMNIDPDGLDRYIAEKGTFDTQISDLQFTAQKLKDEIQTLASSKECLLQENSLLRMIDGFLKTRALTVYCKACRAPLPIQLETRERYEFLIKNGLALDIMCPNCGLQQFNPLEIVTQLGWDLLPTNTATC